MAMATATATPTNFSVQAQRQVLCFRGARGITLNSLPSNKISYPLKQINSLKREQKGTFMRSLQAQNRPSVVVSCNGREVVIDDESPFSASEAIKAYYAYINSKDLKQLENFFSDDCYYEDCFFSKPFRGKKEIMDLFKARFASIGKNFEFYIDYICEGDNNTIGVNWHLDSKRKEVPFSRGCSFYQYIKDGEKLIIKKARVVTESPVKSGEKPLVLYRTLTSQLDKNLKG